ncbi:MAG TPA: hypothetical protein VG820_02250, partial [Fimbriimonadaceae bacterium]|nr:hypothetical protein [Fimbriimonadaceae bacterium]
GIFAFKVDSNGGRSDMAFAEPTDWRRLPKIVDGLVLTEWKVVRTGAEAEEQSQQAIRQIRRYDEGILGGLELVSPRYVVLVSRKHLQHIPESPHVGSVRYQMVNIPVDPDTPSIRMPSD